MDKIQEMLAQRAELDKMISDARREARSEAITKVRTLMAENGLSAADIAGKSAGVRAGSPTGKVAPKYRDKSTGDVWTGRGLQPKWLRAALASGKTLDQFVI